MEDNNIMNFTNYQEKVLGYLEHIGYPELVNDFDVEQVAYAIAGTARTFYHYGNSYRLCAIVIFSLTMKHQIINRAQGMTKH